MVFECPRCGNLSHSTRALNAHNRLCESIDTGHVDPINQTGLHTSSSISENHFSQGMTSFWDAFASTTTAPEAQHSIHHDNITSQLNNNNPALISPGINNQVSNDEGNSQVSALFPSENNINQQYDVDSSPDEPPQQSGWFYLLYQS